MSFAWMRFSALMLLLAVGPGCQWLSRFDTRSATEVVERPAERRPSVDRVILDYRLIDQSAGDPFANDQLWTMTRCPLPHETAALLAENGIRVGVISGITPPEFTARVSAERFAVDPRAILTSLNEEKILPVNGPLDRASLRWVSEWGKPGTDEQWSDVECGLSTTVKAGNAQTVTVACQLAIQNGQKQAWLRPNDDRTKFVWNQQKTRIACPNLSWTVTLDRGDYLVIGPTNEPSGKLGELFFFLTQPAQVRQRFFVLRANHNAADDIKLTSVAAKAGR